MVALLTVGSSACEFYSKSSVEYLSNDPSLANKTNVCSSNTSENTFCHESKKFFHVKVKGHLISKLEEPCEKETRRQPFNIDEAISVSEAYI